MKTSTRLAFMMILIFSVSYALAQKGSGSKTLVSLQLGASAGLSPDFSQPIFIANPGFDFNFRKFGFRTTGQFFNTSPVFDFNTYLAPILSQVTVSNLQKNNSNILLGISPYLSLGNKMVSFQAGFGVKYLIQKTAGVTAVYTANPSIVMLDFSEAQAKSSLFMLEPNIRSVFGKYGNTLRFYLEASYILPAGKTEFNYTTRGNLAKLIDPKTGLLVTKYLDASKPISQTGNIIASFATIGVGILWNLTPNKKPTPKTLMPSVNNYGVNDDGIKRTEPEKVTNKEQSVNSEAVAPFKAGSDLSSGHPRKTIQKLILLTPRNNVNVKDVKELGEFTWQILGDKIKNPQYIIKVEQLDKNRKALQTFTENTQYTKIAAATLFKTDKITPGNYRWEVTETSTGSSSGTMYFNSNPCDFNISIGDLLIECLGNEGSNRKYKICFSSNYQSATGNLTFNNSGSGLYVWDQNNITLTPSTSPSLQQQNGSPANTANYCFEIPVSANSTQINFGLQGDNLLTHLNCSPAAFNTIDSLPPCLCTDCDSLIWNFNLTAHKTSSDQYDLTGSLGVNLPIYGAEFQVQSWTFSPSPTSCSNGVIHLEESGMILLPQTTINNTSAIQLYYVSTPGSNNNATKAVKLLSNTAMPNPLPVNLTIGLPGAIPGLDFNCCVIKYKVCIKATVFYDAEHCKSCTYTKCFEFDNH
jgi:hypothetical protein